jgi:hypothetical protein
LACWEKPVDDPGWRVPIMEVERTIEQPRADLNVIEAACDPFRWQRSMAGLEKRGLPIVEYRTGLRTLMTPATTDSYGAVMDGGFVHDGDPRLARHIANTVERFDSLGRRSAKMRRTRRGGSTSPSARSWPSIEPAAKPSSWRSPRPNRWSRSARRPSLQPDSA